MSNEERRPGHLWALVQDWMDAIPYPPSQRKLAARVGVSPSAMSDWKYGDGFPDPESLGRLAVEIGTPYERVLDAVLKDRGYRQPDRKEGDRDVSPAATKTRDDYTLSARRSRTRKPRGPGEQPAD